MKKILTVFDAAGVSTGAFKLINHLNEQEPLLLTALFIPQLSYADLWSYSSAMTAPYYMPIIEEEDTKAINESVSNFKELCVRNHIEYRIHREEAYFSLESLRKETRFADFMILSSEKFFEHFAGNDPDFYMREALHLSECPVIVVPENFDLPQRNILAYDGTESSVFAIKQFAYLFPMLAANDTLLVYLKKDSEVDFPAEDYIEELCARHFTKLSLLKLSVNPKKYFTTWIGEKKNAVLVSGSFGRSELSAFFRKSFIGEAIAEHKLPVFVSHR